MVLNKELERLEFIADKYFLSLVNITKLLGKNPATFAHYKNKAHISNKLLDELKEKLGINPLFVKFGQGERLLHRNNIVREKNLDNPGYRLEKLMRVNNWRLQDVADIVDVTHQTVSTWKNGRDIPEYALKKLKKHGVDTEWLINGDSKDKEPPKSNENDVKSITICLYNKELRAMTIDEVEHLRDRIKNVYEVLNEFIIATESVYGNQLTGKKDITEDDMVSVKYVGRIK